MINKTKDKWKSNHKHVEKPRVMYDISMLPKGYDLDKLVETYRNDTGSMFYSHNVKD